MSIIKRITSSQLVRGSFLVFIANNAASFGNFLYNLFMGRLLGPEKYGDLGAILSLMVLLGVPLGILSLLVIKLVSSYFGKKDYTAIKALLTYLTPRLFLLGLLVSLLIFFAIPSLSQFLNLDSYLPILIVAFYFILSFPATLNRSILSGSLHFSYLSVNSFAEISGKLIISIALVLLNFGLVGALLGPVIGGVVGYLLSLFELKIIFGRIEGRGYIPTVGMFFRSLLPIFFAYLSLTAFFTVDIILVRHFFTATIAGEYTALSTISKIIYYAVGPVISVMFPVISSRASGGVTYILPLFGTLVMSLGISIVVLFTFFLFPKLIIGILYGSQYFGTISLLGLFSFFITIYSLNAILTNFLLSISYHRPIYPLFLVSLSQGILIFLFHNSLNQVIWVNIITSLVYLLLISLFVIKKEYRVISSLFVKILPKGIYGG